jgi:hypothetical protein
MTDRELAAAARHALIHLEDERELLRNPLLPHDRRLPYDALRSTILCALESLRSSGAGAAANKQRRLHTILLRCDLGGEVHKGVMEAMALSRRQFYRERREALLRFARAITQAFERTRTTTVLVDLGDAGEAYLEALRSAGQHRLVWQEAAAMAGRAHGDPRQIELWLVASEAARFLADAGAAQLALEHAYEPVEDDSYWRRLWLVSGTMSLRWLAGDYAGARAAFDDALRGAQDERALHGKEAVLLGITLCNVARIELDCGHWEQVRNLLVRASYLLQNGTTAKRQSLLRLSVLISRLSAQLALHADGDRARSLVGQRSALDGARASGELGNVAISAIYFATAMAHRDAAGALSYAEYGMEIARRFYPGDRLSELTLEVLPLLLQTRGRDAAAQAVANARCAGLGVRDALFLELADAKVAAAGGDLAGALERAEEVSGKLFERGIDAWGCDAELLAAETSARLALPARARRRLARVAETMGGARAAVRERARGLGTHLAPRIALPA